jgi:hypothetical protein
MRPGVTFAAYPVAASETHVKYHPIFARYLGLEIETLASFVGRTSNGLPFSNVACGSFATVKKKWPGEWGNVP